MPNCQNYCLRLSAGLNAVIICPDYRLAPEHRLPAALHDSVTSLQWLRAQATADKPDPWLVDAADFDRVFISGDSAGGTIAYHLAVGYSMADLAPIKVRGYMLLGPFFGGKERTISEAECLRDAFVNLERNDMFLRLSIPGGADLDLELAIWGTTK